ncbi:DUF1772-domain-containing protein [Penicillium capsulatum]|uniref:DUF1772-domain-containing protein n=1 Tax=Penicillium capsulatum TaxID=69766 RepID=A0A9W9IF03_9EURO|nr:DUF1772-domain-containing protein [Penicillium capsulatum]KAJ6135873.1 DUF1772-domain-containing protein [Penicillium capsulatum]
MSYPLGFRIAQAVGLSGAAWISGNIAGISVNIVPALIRSRDEANASPNLLAKQWQFIYDNGSTQNPPIALVIASAFFYLSWSVRKGAPLYEPAAGSRSGLFAAAGGMILGIVPYTLVAMAKTNKTLMAKAKSVSELSAADVTGLLKTWAGLNLGRGLFPLVGCLCGIAASFP